MKTIYKSLSVLSLFFLLLFISCEEKDERVVYPQSTPVIESATITPVNFTYGDSVVFSAKVSDPLTPLSTLEVTLVVNDKIIANETIRTKGQSTEVSTKLKTEYVSQLSNNANVEVQMKLINVEGNETIGSLSGVTGKRKYYNKLYLVIDNGEVTELLPLATNHDKYSAKINLRNSVRYRIAESVSTDQQVDFTKDVWGLKNNQIQIADQTGDYITTSFPMIKSTEEFIFDTYEFQTTLLGEELTQIETLQMDMFTNSVTQGNEIYKEGNFYIEKNQEIKLTADFADVVFNKEWFERTSSDKMKYIGETGPVTMEYNIARKFVLVQISEASYPDYLLVCGMGLGYPSKIKPEATSGWGFDNMLELKFILFKKIADKVFQGTVYLDAPNANFKPFENSSWQNEKKSDDYTMPSILVNSGTYSDGKDINGNWYAAPDAKSGNYTITIDISKKIVTATEVTLP